MNTTTTTTAPTYFASGSNHEGEIKGFASIGTNVGVAADHLSAGAVEALEGLAGSGIRVFVDSGAFGEIAGFGPAGPIVKRAITHEEWTERLDLALRIGRALGPAASIVAPDRVGCQMTTLARLEAHARRVQAIAATGAEILVPVQKGAVTMAAFFGACCATLGRGVVAVPAIPLKKDATTTAELRAFLAAAKPSRVHLLGLGPKSGRFAEVMAAFADLAPACAVSCDSVAITANVGRGTVRTDGTRGPARGLTLAQDEVASDVIASTYSGHRGDDGAMDYTDSIFDPSSWMTPANARDFAAAVSKNAAERREIARDATAWLNADDVRSYVFAHDLDAAWARYAFASTVVERKRRAVASFFGAKAA